MRGSIRYWKDGAKQALAGRYGSAVLGMLCVTGITFAGSVLSSVLFTGDSIYEMVVDQVFLFIFSLIMTVFSAGLGYMYLNIARGREYSMKDILYFFRNHPDRVIVAGFVLVLINTVVMIPYYYTCVRMAGAANPDDQIYWMEMVIWTMILAGVLNFLLTLPFSMAYYLMADDLDMGGLEALKVSARIMKGHLWKFLLLQVSFLPLIFLSVFTLYLALLWVIPYFQMSTVMFYLDISEELSGGRAITGQQDI